ncbi:hypothetical protein O3M35_007219 [Rhynocoris fuscipes]|uniref:Cytochrome P450 n=1 Tax=Rhynocoris fuscipes TaxID=488301 RepID=A0AAW1D8R2_9HEMI
MWIILISIVLIILLIWQLSQPYYWKNKNLPHLSSLPIFGSFLPSITLGVSEFNLSLYKKFPGERFYGLHMFTRPVLFIKDSELVQRILVTDFEYFTSHGLHGNPEIDPAGGSLFHIYGLEWKEMRAKLSPYFSPAKVKLMLSYADYTLSKAINVIDKKTIDNKPIEMAQILMNITTDIITQAVFGIETDTFENEDSVFSKIAKEIYKTKVTSRLFISMISPKLYDLLRIRMLDKEYWIKFERILKETIEYRKRDNVRKQDFLQGMMDLMENCDAGMEKKYFPDNTRMPCYDMQTLICQSLLLYAAGVETSALTLTYFFYEIAAHPEIQEKCRKEIESVIKQTEDDVDISDLPKLEYLGAALQETLRVHAPLTLITRECTKNYKIPETDLILEKGTLVLMTPNGSQMDPNYFVEPEKFKPERFLNGDNITRGTYYPFGIGPRTCLGMGLANGEMKLVSAKLLKRYEFTLNSKTDASCGKYYFLKTPANGMWLNVRPLKNRDYY